VFLERFTEDSEMVEAVRKAIKLEMINHLPTTKDLESNEILGQKVRAYNTAGKLLDEALINLAKYQGRKNIKRDKQLER
jgi:nitrogenase subunit NifH